MNNYSDLQVTDIRLSVNADNLVKVNNIIVDNNIDYLLPLNNSLTIETIGEVQSLIIDNINVIPIYHYLVNRDYGKWTLTIDRPFYQWLHQAQNQGWLLD